MFDPDGFNIGAERAIFWTREQLESSSDRANNERRWEFLAELPRTHRVGSFLFVHGSPRNPLSEYIFPEDIYNHRKMERLFQLVEQYCFQGHTHVPGVFTEGFQFYAPEEIDNEYTLGDGKAMINVGSVGQPRDGDPRACYVILEDGRAPTDGETGAPGRRPPTPGTIRSARDRPSPRRPGRSASATAACPTTTRRRSRRSTPSPSSSRSWATGSDRDDKPRPARPPSRPDATPPRAPPWPQGLPTR